MNQAHSATQLITSTPERLGGEPVFAGTRVPVQAMFDYLEAGDPLNRFLEHFPDVTQDHALAVLKLARSAVDTSIPASSKVCCGFAAGTQQPT
jgi:uncharacterized protein (DUF433 family)